MSLVAGLDPGALEEESRLFTDDTAASHPSAPRPGLASRTDLRRDVSAEHRRQAIPAPARELPARRSDPARTRFRQRTFP